MENIILLTGLIIVANLIIQVSLARTVVPAMIGYLLLGVLLRTCDAGWSFLDETHLDIFGFLAQIGVIMLLFRVGLESDIKGLLEQLPKAGMIWVGDVVISGIAGFAAAFYLMDLSMATSLIIATAFTATSVGISVAVWQNKHALQSSTGRLLIDIAEMDDISAVILMALLFSLLPLIKNISDPQALLPAVGKTLGIFGIKFVFFGICCLLFSLYIEKPVTDFFRKRAAKPQPMLLVIGIGIMVSSLAAWLGFSFAIGAFFAGLVFSRDPETVKMEANFLPIYDLFSPFFFIGIGLDIDPGVMISSLQPALFLLAAAFLGKFIADGLPVWIMDGKTSALLIGMSMIPRAEIAMIVMQRGLQLGDWAVGPEVYGAMIILCTLTCLIPPFFVQILLEKHPPDQADNRSS